MTKGHMEIYTDLIKALDNRGFDVEFDISKGIVYLYNTKDSNLIKLQELFNWKVCYSLVGEVNSTRIRGDLKGTHVSWGLRINADGFERATALLNEYWDKPVPKLVTDSSDDELLKSLRVDDVLKPLLILFRKLGFYSRYCCSGHNVEEGYIKFTQDLPAQLGNKLKDVAELDSSLSRISFETNDIGKLEDILRKIISCKPIICDDFVGRAYSEVRDILESRGYGCTFYGNSQDNGIVYFETQTSVIKLTYTWDKVQENNYKAGKVLGAEDLTECYR